MISKRKKIILIAAIVIGLVAVLGLILVAGAQAAYNDVKFSAPTPLAIQDLTVQTGSQVVSLVVNNDSTVTVTLALYSSITITSAQGRVMQLNQTSVATNRCYADDSSSITIPYNATYPTVILSLTGTLCTGAKGVVPTVSGVKVGSKTTVVVTMSEKITYVTLPAVKTSADLLNGNTTFAGKTATAVTLINGSSTSFTLTFASGDLTSAGVTDVSKLIMPAGVLENATGGLDFAGLTAGSNQYVTDLASINQLYDFVFAIQPGKNFMSVPFEVSTTLANSYTDPGGVPNTSIQYITDATAGTFANASSYNALYGYYILSSAPTNVYLRLNKTASVGGFSRTFTATGWHIIGVASNDVEDSNGAHTDDDVLVSLDPGGTSYYYDIVMDVATIDGAVGNNTNLSDPLGFGTYDPVLGVYKALWDDNDIVTASHDGLAADVAGSGIEFNHGEAYFIYINAQNAKYTGTPVDADKLTY